MSTYTPDKWVMLKITSEEFGTIYKVLASWFGGFGGSNSWKLSSETTGALYDPKSGYTHFPQYSGSEYVCGKYNYGTSMHTQSILVGWQEQLKSSTNTIEVMEENFNIDILNQT
jgi:hypothetical protein